MDPNRLYQAGFDRFNILHSRINLQERLMRCNNTTGVVVNLGWMVGLCVRITQIATDHTDAYVVGYLSWFVDAPGNLPLVPSHPWMVEWRKGRHAAYSDAVTKVPFWTDNAVETENEQNSVS